MAIGDRIRQARHLLTLLRRTGVRVRHILLPVVFSLLTAALTGLGLGLLVPLANGLAEQDYSSALSTPLLGDFVRAVADESNQRQVLLALCVAVFAVNVVNFFLRYLAKLYARYWHGVFAVNVGDLVFGRLMTLSRRYYDENSQGSLTQVMSFAASVNKALEVIQVMSTALFQLLGRFAVMIWISWRLAIAALIVLPILQLSVSWMRQRIRRLSRERTDARVNLSRDVFNMLSSIDLVKAYGHEGPVRERYRQERARIRELEFRSDVWSGLVWPIQDTIILLALLGMVVTAAFTIGMDDRGRIAEFVVLFYVARSALPHFATLTRGRFDLLPLIPELKHIWDVLEQTDQYIVPSGDRKLGELSRSLELRDLRFSYRADTQVLRGVSFEVMAGSTTALVGTTGSGKSTIVKLLLRFYDCPPGAILIDGIDIRELSHESLRRQLDYVSQDVLLFNDTVRANLTFGMERDVDDDELWILLRQVRLADSIELAGGLDVRIGDNGVKLSGGERQRLALARSLARRAPILILDEATSALDAETEQHVHEQLGQSRGRRTTIMIAHRLSTVRTADRIVVLDRGEVVETGSFDELMSQRGRFSAMWAAYHRGTADGEGSDKLARAGHSG